MPKKKSSQTSKSAGSGRALTEDQIEKAVIRTSTDPLVTKLAAAAGAKEQTVVRILESLTEIAYRETKKNGEFVLPGIGKLVKVKSKSSRNPRAVGKTIGTRSNTVEFRVARAAKDSVLKKRQF